MPVNVLSMSPVGYSDVAASFAPVATTIGAKMDTFGSRLMEILDDSTKDLDKGNGGCRV